MTFMDIGAGQLLNSILKTYNRTENGLSDNQTKDGTSWLERIPIPI